MEILGTLETLMVIYEIASGIGGVLQIILLLLKYIRHIDNHLLLILGMLLDAIGLSGMSCGHALMGEIPFAILDIAAVFVNVGFIVYVLYRDEHPKK